MKNLLKIWEEEHFEKIVQELTASGIDITHENILKIIEETSFRVRSKKFKKGDPDGCPYYDSGISCHPEINDLSCLLCACPNYDTSSLEGGCVKDNKDGKWTYHQNLPKKRVWDCSDCNFGHSPTYVRGWLEKNLDKLLEISRKL